MISVSHAEQTRERQDPGTETRWPLEQFYHYFLEHQAFTSTKFNPPHSLVAYALSLACHLTSVNKEAHRNLSADVQTALSLLVPCDFAFQSWDPRTFVDTHCSPSIYGANEAWNYSWDEHACTDPGRRFLNGIRLASCVARAMKDTLSKEHPARDTFNLIYCKSRAVIENPDRTRHHH